MLGSVSEAEDALQETFIRWQQADLTHSDNPTAYLHRITSRICLDFMKKAYRQREVYLGTWLPEPEVADVSAQADADGNASVALLLALEQLSPPERAVFILHDLFDMPYQELAVILARSEASCRQLVSRARARLAKLASINSLATTAEVGDAEAASLSRAFFLASREGDTETLAQLLAAQAKLYSDGGGKRSAALRVIFSADKISRLFAGLARKIPNRAALWCAPVRINGMHGWLSLERDGYLQTTAVEVSGGCIQAVYIVRNPDKLAHLRCHVPNQWRGYLTRH